MYRTRTYLAGDWDGDSDLIQTIMKWNDNGYLALDFGDAHELKQARDNSLNCSIKKSLSDRLSASKKFVLIVGTHTKTVTKGSCQHCPSYVSYVSNCRRNSKNFDKRSFVEYECDIAERDYRLHNMKILVIYNSATINKNLCPDILKNIGSHITGICRNSMGDRVFDYQKIKKAIME